MLHNELRAEFAQAARVTRGGKEAEKNQKASRHQTQ